jgi:hypothetical protein
MTTVSDAFGIPDSTVHDMKLSQPSRFQLERIILGEDPQVANSADSVKAEDVRSIMAHLVCHTVSLANSGFNVAKGKLWSKDKLDRHPPKLEVYQLDVIAIKTPGLQDDDVLLTMMKDPLSFHPRKRKPVTRHTTLTKRIPGVRKSMASTVLANDHEGDVILLDPLEELLDNFHIELQNAENGYM